MHAPGEYNMKIGQDILDSSIFSEIHAQQYETIFLSGQKEEEWSGMYICNNNK